MGSKVQKKALIENKEAKNDDHIDDSDAKILPIISQQAGKKNGEVKTILELAENKKAENADSDVKKNEVKTILELAENKKMEKTRKVNVQEIPKIQRVENDDYIHYVEASDTKFLSKVQKKAPIENKEAKNDDHIDNSNPKILPIISQQAVKKNGEVKTILELAENKKAENADSGVKKNEE